tara:strand:+ start:3999 stop:6080 length:2082 start_codon:yes stop_codon:yes gene_type:complete
MDGLFVGTGLSTSGWISNSENNEKNINDSVIKSDSVYDSRILDGRLVERQKIENSLHDSNMITDLIERPESGRIDSMKSSPDKIMSLSGEMMSNENFTHNNMVPFFGSNVHQNMESNANSSILEKYTGVSKIHQSKEETTPMFKLRKENIHGTSAPSDALRERFNASRYNQGVPLTEPVQVGPGLNKGYVSNPSGGFNQTDTLDYIQPATVDELRVKSNPKVTYEGRMVSGFKGTRRGLTPTVNKNRVITYHSYDDCPRLNTTVVTSGSRAPENFIDKGTNRQNTLSTYTAPAGPAVRKNVESHSSYKDNSHRNNLDTYGMRNATDTKRESRLNIQYCSEIRKTKPVEKTYLGNASTLVQNIIAPLQDVLRPTIKETNVHDSSPNRNMNSVVTSVPVYDPNDVLRPTIKETNIHDVREGFLGKTKEGMHTYNPEDTTRTTLKETMIHDDRLSGINSYQSSLYANAPSELKVTARETLKQYINNKSVRGATQQSKYNMTAPQATLKDTVIDNKYSGIATYSKNDGYKTTCVTAPATNKQFTSDNEYSGAAQGRLSGGYKVKNAVAPPTNKQFTSDVEYTGNAEGDLKPMSYSDIYNATINEVKEGISKGRAPTQTGLKENATSSNLGEIEQRIPLTQTQNISAVTPIQNIPLYENINPISDSCEFESMTNDRNDPRNLAAFHNNPFTKPLNSTA